jgi:predicted transcriptional regulator of viral defense system
MENYMTKQEQRIYSQIEEHKEIFTIEDILKIIEIKKNNLRVLLHNLEKKNYILRISKGNYIIEKRFLEKPYYYASKKFGIIAYISALKIYGLLDYEPNIIYLIEGKSKEIKIKEYTIKIIQTKYKFGIIRYKNMLITDMERTFLDLLMNPTKFDFNILIKGFIEYDFDFKKMLIYLKQINLSSIYQKTGFILENLYKKKGKKLPETFVNNLKKKIKNNIKMIPINTNYKYDKKWKIMDNVKIPKLIEAI